MVEIICLANSDKHQERCLAGINPQTGKWIRPIYTLSSEYSDDGRIPKNVRLIDNKEPEILDLIDIPLENTGPDFGFESENLNISLGPWKKVRKIELKDVLKYCQNQGYILHNDAKYVTKEYLQSLSFSERKTLQLLYTSQLIINRDQKYNKWRGTITNQEGKILNDLPITDPEFLKKLDNGYQPKKTCIITLSLSMPYRPERWQDQTTPCWKLIAGIMEISALDLILVEMQRLNWSIEQGRRYLRKNYQKSSRKELNSAEIKEFIKYLQSLK